MLERLTCLQGHAWEAATDSALCPECGLPPDPGLFAEPDDAPAPIPPPPIRDDKGKPVVVGYEILADRGRSPAGVRLYQAKQLVAGREVLLEVVLAREDAGQRAWNALRGEASGHGKLSHPHIVQLYETGERERQLFYSAMEYVDGPTLAEAVGDEPVPVAEAVALVELLARAVAYANEQRQIHRHLEPSAVLLQRVPAPKGGPAKANPGGGVCRLGQGYYIPRIRGFGLARRPVEGDILDVDLYAEPGYLSPEQSWGKGHDLGPHTDVYGLGGILYFLLTGRPPFRGPTQDDILDAIQTAPLVKPSDIHRTPAALAFVCRAALARRVSRRYADAGEMADDLRRVALHIPPVGSKLSLWRRLALFCRRRPATVMGLGLLLWIALGILGAYVAISATNKDDRDAMRNRHDAAQVRAENGRLRDQIERITAWQRRNDYQGRINFAALVAGTNKQAARDSLDECAESERGFEWHYLNRLLAGEEKTILPDSEDATSFALLSGMDRIRIAVATKAPGDNGATIRVLDLATSNQHYAIIDVEFPVRRLLYLGDDKLAVLAGTRPGRFYVFRKNGMMGQADTVTSPSIAGRGVAPNQILVLNNLGDLRSHDANSARPFGQAQTTLRGGMVKSPRIQVALLPRGLGVAVSDPNKPGVHLWNGNPSMVRFEELDEKVECMASDAEGVLAVATEEKRIHFTRITDGTSQAAPYQGAKNDVKHMAFSPDGEHLAIAYGDGTVTILAFLPPRPERLRNNDKEERGRWLEMVTISVSGVRGVEFGYDGRTLAASGPKGVVVLGAWK